MTHHLVMAAALAVFVFRAPLALPCGAQSGSSPLNEEEEQLLEVEENVISLQRELSAARKRGDDAETIGVLQKKFDKLQKRRVGLLRDTWQM